MTTTAGALTHLLVTVALSAAFVGLMLAVVRPLLARLLDAGVAGEHVTRDQVAIILGLLLFSSVTTELIGIHALFGAFLGGVVMPAHAPFRGALRERFDSLGAVLLLPLFFATTGLRTQVALLDDATSWLMCAASIVVATAGKLGGTAVAARWTGLRWRHAVSLGALMNTRGLMELVALNVGYDLGILTPRVFAMMVLMALATTAMTAPLLALSAHVGPETRRTTGGPDADAPSS